MSLFFLLENELKKQAIRKEELAYPTAPSTLRTLSWAARGIGKHLKLFIEENKKLYPSED